MEPLTLAAIVTILANNLWVGLLAIVVYSIWRATPKVFDAFERHLISKADGVAKMSVALDNNTGALGKICEAINSFEKALLGTESRLKETFVTRLDQAVNEIREEVQDQKFKLIAGNAFRESSPIEANFSIEASPLKAYGSAPYGTGIAQEEVIGRGKLPSRPKPKGRDSYGSNPAISEGNARGAG